MDATLPPARTPSGFTEVAAWAVTTTDDLTHVRDALYTMLPGSGTRRLGEIPESIVLVTSELTTNALRHGRAPALVRLHQSRGAYMIEVVDHAPESAPVVAGPRAAGEGGFGLVLASRLAQDVGWYSTRTAKHVWAVLAADDRSRLTTAS
ncbi:histidine kinase-like protein [Sediminihabitans luteus]|uniref:Histidine kinase-like protein n=1 Tax=Sediminihabitans luteus TaxID=1138585 RepID=A0A2M9D0U6_9CELL|nr:ATP-binding protein [Sediminihabitans luteus]PJJ77821.1 histidine kinase-like protein [Sediminihabitans luteus]GII99821.1 ATP-binding protein [Sediminihabitans luteus]